MPQDVRDDLGRLAEANGSSLNAYIVSALCRHLGRSSVQRDLDFSCLAQLVYPTRPDEVERSVNVLMGMARSLTDTRDVGISLLLQILIADRVELHLGPDRASVILGRAGRRAYDAEMLDVAEALWIRSLSAAPENAVTLNQLLLFYYEFDRLDQVTALAAERGVPTHPLALAARIRTAGLLPELRLQVTRLADRLISQGSPGARLEFVMLCQALYGDREAKGFSLDLLECAEKAPWSEITLHELRSGPS